mmetsp:Transcript_80213/g.186248  ORF Transcript_80213/g.186248 Transcript_80213/m.186248 type:complete len:503 (+) Transcript_80213:106-1614(+)
MLRRTAVAVLAAGVWPAAAQSDGNPHHWDRHRRCDHAGYSPKCGLCEGVGGIVWSDAPKDIHVAACTPVASRDQLDPKSIMRPVWGADFSVLKSHEILIGKKQDLACFQAFPSNDSTSTNCYKPQECKIYSDMNTVRALRIEANQAGNAWGIFGNVTSLIYHQGGNMWIINHLPLGITQTVCAAPTEGGDPTKPAVNPVQYNWVDNLDLVGRETIDVEYGVGNLTLDHWAFGPHHAWTDPKTGIIVRMWQPFNGLQIFEPGSFKTGHDPALFKDLAGDGSRAPPQARPWGSTFRVKCDKNGFPNRKEELAQQPQARKVDLQRARTRVPRAQYRGSDFHSMSNTLNDVLRKRTPRSRECELWSVEELQQLQLLLLMLRDPELDAIYHHSRDNRRVQREVTTLAREWEELNALAARDPELARIHRDGHCHEAVMWYVHHLPEDVRVALKDKVSLPLLSYTRHSVPAAADAGARRVHQAYEEKVTCASCHSAVFPPNSSSTELVI